MGAVFGYWDGDPKKVVRPHILIIHYDFANYENQDRRKDDEKDVHNLLSTLKPVGRVRETSDKKEKVLKILGDEKELRTMFDLEGDQTPELFMVFIMTHGDQDGEQLTTHHGEKFKLSDLCDKMKGNAVLDNSLKLLFVSACRGIILDEVLHSGETRDAINLPEGSIWSSQISKDGKENLDAVRVTTEPDSENFIIMFSSVKGTLALRYNGTLLVRAFCECFEELEQDVSLVDFLTRVMWYLHEGKDRLKGFGSTPEIKILKHSRSLIVSRQCDENPNKFAYKWASTQKVPLLTRKAHFYITPPQRTCETVQKLSTDLFKKFEFKEKKHDTFDELKAAVADPRGESDGCILLCIVATMSRNASDKEISVQLDGKMTSVKQILYSLLSPNTGNWTGKPKICVFLNSPPTNPEAVDDGRKDKPGLSLAIRGTIHAGLITIILPQKDAVVLFVNTLKEYSKIEMENKPTFQQFFYSLLQKAEPWDAIPPMMISTLHNSLEFEFPTQLAIDSFTMENRPAGSSLKVSLKYLLELISLGRCKNFSRSPDRRSSSAVGFDTVSFYGRGAQPLDKAEMIEANQKEGEEEATEEVQYMVYVVLADAGSGKSELVNHLVNWAKRSRKVTHINLLRDSKFLKSFDCNADCKEFVEEYRRHIGLPRTFEKIEVVILDAIDALHGDLLDKMLKMAQNLAKNKVDLWCFSRPACEDALKACFEEIGSPFAVIKIDDLTEENQVKFLQQRLGNEVDEASIKNVLQQLKEAHAHDLICKVGTLDKLSTFPNLATQKQVNIYEISAHVVESAVKTYLNPNKKVQPEWEYQQLRTNYVKNLTELASRHFHKDPYTPQNVKQVYPVVHLGGTLAAYLYVNNSKLENAEEIENMPIGKEMKAILARMFQDERKSAIHQDDE